MFVNCIAIGAGGAIGAILRYLISVAPIPGKENFPIATLGTNVLGALVIGLIAGLTLKGYPIDARLSLFLRVGICGGFTTFSTFALETTNLFSAGKNVTVVLYITCSLVLGVFAVMAGEFFAGKI